MSQVTRIAVVADTHDRVPLELPWRLTGAEAIWHLGDVCHPRVLDEFLALGLPLRVVRGNCDYEFSWPLAEDFTEQGHRIRLVHIPPAAAPPGVELVLHGHTHVPRNERIGSARFLNPGCVSRANRGAPASFAWLGLAPGQPPEWEVVRL